MKKAFWKLRENLSFNVKRQMKKCDSMCMQGRQHGGWPMEFLLKFSAFFERGTDCGAPHGYATADNNKARKDPCIIFTSSHVLDFPFSNSSYSFLYVWLFAPFSRVSFISLIWPSSNRRFFSQFKKKTWFSFATRSFSWKGM